MFWSVNSAIAAALHQKITGTLENAAISDHMSGVIRLQIGSLASRVS
jgi:hypothetical protein